MRVAYQIAALVVVLASPAMAVAGTPDNNSYSRAFAILITCWTAAIVGPTILMVILLGRWVRPNDPPKQSGTDGPAPASRRTGAWVRSDDPPKKTGSEDK